MFVVFVFLSILALVALVARPAPAPRSGVPQDLLMLLQDPPYGREGQWTREPGGDWVER